MRIKRCSQLDGYKRWDLWISCKHLVKRVSQLLKGKCGWNARPDLQEEVWKERRDAKHGITRVDPYYDAMSESSTGSVYRDAISMDGYPIQQYRQDMHSLPDRHNNWAPQADRKAIVNKKTIARDQISLISWNVASLRGAKEYEIGYFLQCRKPTVIGFQETQRTGRDWILRLPGYIIIESLKDASIPGSHGIALCLRKNSSLTMLELIKSPYWIFARIQGNLKDIHHQLPTNATRDDGNSSSWNLTMKRNTSKRRDLIVGSIYIPGMQTGIKNQVMMDLVNQIGKLKEKYPSTPMVLMGDWNTSINGLHKWIDKNSSIRSMRSSSSSGLANMKVAPNANNTYFQRGNIQLHATFNWLNDNRQKSVSLWKRLKGRSSCIDHMIISNNIMSNNINVGNDYPRMGPSNITNQVRVRSEMSWSLSDHVPIVLKLNLRTMKRTGNDSASKTIRNGKLDSKKMDKSFQDIQRHNKWSALLSYIDENDNGNIEAVDSIAKKFQDISWQVAKECQVVSSNGRPKQSLNIRSCTKRAIDKKRRLKKELLHTSPIDPTYPALDQSLHEAAKLANKLVKEDQKEHWSKYIEKSYIHWKNKDPRGVWTWIKDTIAPRDKDSAHCSHPILINGHLETDPTIITKEWSLYLSNLAQDTTGNSRNFEYWKTREAANNNNNMTVNDQSSDITMINDPVNAPLTWPECHRTIKKMAQGKAAGLDGITVEWCKCAIRQPKGIINNDDNNGLNDITKRIKPSDSTIILSSNSIRATTSTATIIDTRTTDYIPLIGNINRTSDQDRNSNNNSSTSNSTTINGIMNNNSDNQKSRENGNVNDTDNETRADNNNVGSINTSTRNTLNSTGNNAQDDYENDQEPNNPMAQALWKLISTVWDREKIPKEWEIALVVPIPKKGDRSLMDNYRGISLMTTGLKIITTVLADRLQSMAERKKLLRREQAGFRCREECIGQATALYEILLRRQLANMTSYACFIDFCKAYDRVPHGALLYKLEYAMGLGNGKCMRLIKAIYDNPRLSVKSSSCQDPNDMTVAPISCGLRQGCPTSPILFNMFINDLMNGMEPYGVMVPGLPVSDNKVSGLLFADDAVLLAPNKDSMRTILEMVHVWCIKWEMSVNIQKCGIMQIDPLHSIVDSSLTNTDSSNTSVNVAGNGQDDSLSLFIGDKPVPVVDEYCYLGNLLKKDLDLTYMVKARVAKGSRALEMARPLLWTKTIPIWIKKLVIRSLIIPTMTFGSEIWGMNQERAEIVDRVIKKALGIAMRCSASGTPMDTLRSELAIPRAEAITAGLRARGWSKFATLNTWIKVLINNDVSRSGPLTSKKWSWTKSTEHWLQTKVQLEEFANKNRLNIKWEQLSPKDRIRFMRDEINCRTLGQQVSKALMQKRMSESKVKASQTYLKRGYLNLTGWLSISMYYPRLNEGFKVLTMMRAGTFRTALMLTNMGILPLKWKTACPCCLNVSQNGPETIEHIILECPKWGSVRKETKLSEAISLTLGGNSVRNLPSKERVGLLLGGECWIKVGDRERRFTLSDWKALALRKRRTRSAIARAKDVKKRDPVWLCLVRFLQSIQNERYYLIGRLAMAHRQTNLTSQSQSPNAG